MDHTRATFQATLALVPAPDAESPAGALITSDGRQRLFFGWIELASAIEDWRHTCEPPANHATERRPIT